MGYMFKRREIAEAHRFEHVVKPRYQRKYSTVDAHYAQRLKDVILRLTARDAKPTQHRRSYRTKYAAEVLMLWKPWGRIAAAAANDWNASTHNIECSDAVVPHPGVINGSAWQSKNGNKHSLLMKGISSLRVTSGPRTSATSFTRLSALRRISWSEDSKSSCSNCSGEVPPRSSENEEKRYASLLE